MEVTPQDAQTARYRSNGASYCPFLKYIGDTRILKVLGPTVDQPGLQVPTNDDVIGLPAFPSPTLPLCTSLPCHVFPRLGLSSPSCTQAYCNPATAKSELDILLSLSSFESKTRPTKEAITTFIHLDEKQRTPPTCRSAPLAMAPPWAATAHPPLLHSPRVASA